MATYGLSSLGQIMLIDEGFETTSPERLIYLIFTSVLCACAIMNLYYYYEKLQFKTQNRQEKFGSSKLQLSIMMLYILSHIVSTVHYVDHQYRPVAYHHSKWSYQKYFVTELEIATYAHAIITIVGLNGMRGILRGIQEGKMTSFISNSMKLNFYIFACFYHLVHYTIEPPSNFDRMANFTIICPAVICVPMFVLIIQYCTESLAAKKQLQKEDEARLTDRRSRKSETKKSTARRRSRTPQ